MIVNRKQYYWDAMIDNKKVGICADLAQELEKDLLNQYGPVLTGDALRRTLGYPSMNALRQAIYRNKVTVPLFKMNNRRGRFALAKDVANWLAEERNLAVQAGAVDSGK